VVLSYVEFGPATGNIILAIVALEAIVGTWLWLKFFPNSRIARRFVSQASVGEMELEKRELLNGTGEALSDLRPSGTARINGQRVDVVTEGGFIEQGAKIKVIAVEGSRIVVRPV
jgi:membrane-bound serine protease (ClpP class)